VSAPTIHSDPLNPAIIGAAHEICFVGGTGRNTISNNSWTLDTQQVDAIDISDLTNHGNSNITHSTPPLCDVCSCYKKYLSVEGIGERIEAELERTGFAAFFVTMYQLDGAVNNASLLCSGVRNRYLSVLFVRSVAESLTGERADVTFSITPASSKHFSLATGKLIL
jgi:hypothetical protein